MTPHRLLALALGSSFAGGILWMGLWLRNRPGPTHDIELHVVDQRGNPVEWFGWDLIDDAPGATLNTWTRPSSHPGGIAQAHVPEHPVSFEFESPGKHRTKTDTLGPTSFPARLDVILPDIGVVTGMVRFAGKPIAGAQVMLAEIRLPACADVPSGLLFGSQDLLATTDEFGAFRIGSDWPRTSYYVRAWKAGLAAGSSGPVHTGDPSIDVDLHAGGTIDGRLKFADARKSGGVEIELYRVDPYPWELDAYGHFAATTANDGAFRFEHVEPGPWLVRLKNQGEGETRAGQPRLDQVPFVVEVSEQRITALDMDLSARVARLEGKTELNGKPWTKAWPHLLLIGEKALFLDQATPDEAGRWILRTRAPGTYRLVVWGDREHAGEPEEVSEVVDLTLDGVQWDRDIPWSR